MVDLTRSRLRAKKLGVLIADARLTAGKQVAECANAIGVTPSQFEAYELGDDSPSLPEVELLAYFLLVPLDHFWGNKSLSSVDTSSHTTDINQLIEIRNKLIGASLRKSRSGSDLSLEEAAQQSGLDVVRLEEYELGQAPVPVPILENLTDLYGIPIRDYFDETGPAGQWKSQQRLLQEYFELPPELRSFVAKPVNRPYLELAQRLSDMSVDKLRAVAEVLLEITL